MFKAIYLFIFLVTEILDFVIYLGLGFVIFRCKDLIFLDVLFNFAHCSCILGFITV